MTRTENQKPAVRGRGLLAHILLPHLILVVASLLLFSIFIRMTLSSVAMDANDRIMEVDIQGMKSHLADFVANYHNDVRMERSPEEILHWWLKDLSGSSRHPGAQILVVNASGLVLAQTPFEFVETPRLIPGSTVNQVFNFPDGTSAAFRVIMDPEPYQLGSRVIVYVGLARPLDIIDTAIRGYHQLQLYLLMIFLVVIVAADIVLITRLMAPLKRLSAQMASLSLENWEQLDPIVNGAKEFRVLSEQFVSLIERLRKDFDQRRRFTEDLAHQIRTPLTVSLMQIDELLRKTKGLSVVTEKLEDQREQLWKLSSTIDTLLMVSRFESMNALPKPAEMVLGELVSDLLDLYVPTAELEGLVIEPTIDNSFMIWCDERILKQAMANLLDNAIKYGKKGKLIRLVVRREGPNGVVEIRNYGPPIPPYDLPRLFERFYRTSENETSGFGLGLSIVKQIVSLHRGTIRVESDEQRGTAFIMTFPVIS